MTKTNKIYGRGDGRYSPYPNCIREIYVYITLIYPFHKTKVLTNYVGKLCKKKKKKSNSWVNVECSETSSHWSFLMDPFFVLVNFVFCTRIFSGTNDLSRERGRSGWREIVCCDQDRCALQGPQDWDRRGGDHLFSNKRIN